VSCIQPPALRGWRTVPAFQQGPHVHGVGDGQHLGVRSRRQAGDELSIVDSKAVDKECVGVAPHRAGLRRSGRALAFPFAG
jgi:hypothetical protein